MQEISLTGATMLDSNPSSAPNACNHQHNCHDHQHHGHNHNQKDTELVQLQQQQHQQGQSHIHDHGGDCCGAPSAPILPQVRLQMPVAELVQQTPEQVRQALLTLVKLGPHSLFQEILDAWQSHDVEAYQQTLVSYDTSGQTLLHWAAKRPDQPQFLQTLLPLFFQSSNNKTRDNLLLPTKDDTRMTPLHWACTEAHNLPAVRQLLQAMSLANSSKNSGMHARDATGCTPLLIAAQYGQVETVAYLVHQGADLQAVDTSKDTATHWAAYKGSHAVLGLLSFYDDTSSSLTQPDAYGQSPLHLAALRGHATVCRYIVETLPARMALKLLQTADQNGRTPVALAQHKEQWAVVQTLQECQAELMPVSRLNRIVKCVLALPTLLQRDTWKVWLGVSTHQNSDAPPKAPYYYVLMLFALNFCYYFTVLLPIFTDMSRGVLWDYMGTHVLTISMLLLAAINVYWVGKTDPGSLKQISATTGGSTKCKSVADIQVYRDLYRQTLDQYAQDNTNTSNVQLCHSCHVARPPRSKHDRYTHTCVLLFDHHCPFVGATIGLYNYVYFFLALIGMTGYFLGLGLLMYRHHERTSGGSNNTNAMSWGVLLLGLYLLVHILMSGTMLIYHTQLVAANLTTNEHLNMGKYPYLWKLNSAASGTSSSSNGTVPPQQQPKRVYRNPWNHGWVRNFVMRWQSQSESFVLPEYVQDEQKEALLSSVV